MKTSTLRTGTLVAAAALACSLPALANASPPQKTEKAAVKVSYKDLDVRTTAGAKALYARLKQASRAVCDVRSVRETGNIRIAARAKDCYEEALAEAVDRVDNPLVDELHAG